MRRRWPVGTEPASRVRRSVGTVAIAVLLGAAIIGGGGRAVMRALALLEGRSPAFSTGGMLDILLYGALVGIAGGLLLLPLQRLRLPWPVAGIAVAVAAFAGTILTLPDHIAATVDPFRPMIALVLCLFGACFLAFGLALAALRSAAARPGTVRPD